MRTVESEFYLVLSPKMAVYDKDHIAGLAIPKISKGSPTLGRNEVVMKLKIEVPESLFLKPSLEASIVVPADKVSSTVITPEIQENIREVVKQSTGLDLSITLINPVEQP